MKELYCTNELLTSCIGDVTTEIATSLFFSAASFMFRLVLYNWKSSKVCKVDHEKDKGNT